MYRLDGTEFEEPFVVKAAKLFVPGEVFAWSYAWYIVTGLNQCLSQEGAICVFHADQRQLLSWGPRRLGAQDQSLHF